MAIWNKLRSELDRAGRVAQEALDEGKLRLEIFRARQLVDRAAQSLGYAVYRARTGKETPDEAIITRLVDAVREREAEVAVLEEKMRDVTGKSAASADAPPSAEVPTAGQTPGSDPTGAAAGEPTSDSMPRPMGDPIGDPMSPPAHHP